MSDIANFEEKDYTLVFCRRTNPETEASEVLLGMKKRGFGVGKWNGFGGKLEPNETIEEAAIRELQEESGLLAKELSRIGYLVFKMNESSKIMRVHVYTARSWEGTEYETEEMRPQWYKESELPFNHMWPDDPYWMPYLLQNKSFVGRFEYEDDDTIIDHSVQEQK